MRWTYLVETLMVQLLLTVFGCMKRYFSTFIAHWLQCSSEDLLTVSLRTANVVLFKKFKIMFSTSYAWSNFDNTSRQGYISLNNTALYILISYQDIKCTKREQSLYKEIGSFVLQYPMITSELVAKGYIF